MYTFENGECYVEVSWGSASEGTNLPCYPQEVQSSIAANWGSSQVIGRTGELFSYTGASDVDCNFTMDLHREMCLTKGSPIVGCAEDIRSVDEIVLLLKAACYPKYAGNTLQPPRVTFKFGDYWITGRMSSASEVWKGPIIDKKYAVCSVSIQMKSAAIKILGQDDILNNMHSARGHYI